MLVLTRRVGEELLINNAITIMVTRTQGNHVGIGVKAPQNMKVVRSEIEGNMNMPFDTKEAAVQAAEGVVYSLAVLHDWRIDVWENAGWRFCVVRGNFSIHMNDSMRFCCLINDGQQGPGPWTSHEWWVTAQQALEREIIVAKEWNITQKKMLSKGIEEYFEKLESPTI